MYRVEVVTPAGRRRYLEILYKYLKNQKADFEKWQLWQNTQDVDDIKYMDELAANNDWITVIKPTWPYNGNLSIYKFFENTKRDDTIYIRLDDDIVYLSPNFIKELVTKRQEMPYFLFMYPNIINNAIISNLHYSNGLIPFNQKPGYECMDPIGWKNPQFCETLHRSFLKDLTGNRLEKWTHSFNVKVCNNYERVSINCLCWFGSDMKNYIRQVGTDEEQFLSVDICRRLKRFNVIVGSPICAHFAFFTQRDYIEGSTNILEQYNTLSKSLDTL